jgi:hypothetical protein
MLGFVIPELIIESLIRDGIQNTISDPRIIDDLFSGLTKSYNRKYGSAEIAKIKALLQKEIAIVYSYNQVDQKPITISIMIGSDTEAKNLARIGDYEEGITEEIANPTELQALHRVNNLQVTAYDPNSGQVSVVDGTDLSVVYANMIYVDSIGTEHDIVGGIDNTPGSKMFHVNKGDEVDFSNASGYIRSSLDYKVYEVRGVTGDVNMVLGVHSKDALTTKYLYVLLKYWILSRKFDMIKRGLFLASYSGSDFNRDQQFIGDQVYTRFLTITGKVEDTWRSDQVVLIDNIEVDADPIE